MNNPFARPNGENSGNSGKPGSNHSDKVKRKQYLLLGGMLLAVGLVSVVGAYLVGKPSSPSEKAKAAAQPVVKSMMVPGSAMTDKDGWRGQESARITELTNQVKEQAAVLKRMQEEIGRKSGAMPNVPGSLIPGAPSVAQSGSAPPPGDASALNGQTIGAKIGTKIRDSMGIPTVPVAPTAKSASPGTATGTPTGIPGVTQGGASVAPPSMPAAQKPNYANIPPTYPPGKPNGTIGGMTIPGQATAPVEAKPRIASLSDDDSDGDAAASKTGTTPVALNLAQKSGSTPKGPPVPVASGRTAENYLPSGTFMKGRTLAGMDAPTGGQSQNNPMPMLIQITDNAFLPSRMRGEVKECFVVASGFGDISSERARIRTESISCIKEDGTAIDMPILGYVSGEDGKAGMRGRLVSKQGQALANALQAGVLSGFSDALKFSASTNVVGALGGVAQVPTAGKSFQAGVGTGMGKSLDRLAQYYISLAEKMFPVIEIDADREITVVLTRGTFIDNRMPTPMGGSAVGALTSPGR